MVLHTTLVYLELEAQCRFTLVLAFLSLSPPAQENFPCVRACLSPIVMDAGSDLITRCMVITDQYQSNRLRNCHEPNMAGM